MIRAEFVDSAAGIWLHAGESVLADCGQGEFSMARYSRNEFLFAQPIATALLSDPDFRDWFLSQTKLAAFARELSPLASQQAALRTTPDSRKWFWFNVWCPKDRNCECRGEKGIESDILLVFLQKSGRKTALHIEVKPPHEKFRPDQAESYPRRGRCWANSDSRPRTILAHDDFVTMLVCGRDLIGDPRLVNFDDFALHEDIALRLSPYPAPTDIRGS